MLATNCFLRSVFVEKIDIWNACIMAFTSNNRTLLHSPLVLIYRQNSTVVSKTLVYSEPKTGVWGITPICLNTQCQSQAGDTFSKTHKVGNMLSHMRASWSCKRCKGKTNVFDRPSWIEEVPDRRHYYAYEYPFEDKVGALADSLVWR